MGAITRVPQRVDEFVSRVLGEDIPEGMTSGSHIRYGFWLALGTLVALAAGNAFALLRAQRAGDPQLVPVDAAFPPGDPEFDPADSPFPPAEDQGDDDPGREDPRRLRLDELT